uniref:Uncharacterized protein n=1 Tax=viral metagenome TaxID=1070528 RepID=A0A6C0AFF9_9ZZZZ
MLKIYNESLKKKLYLSKYTTSPSQIKKNIFYKPILKCI